MRFTEAVNNYLTNTDNRRVEIKDSVMDYFYKNPNSTVQQMRQWADETGIGEELNVEDMLGEIITEYLQFIKGGLWNESSKPDVNEDELNIGIQLEFNHAENVDIAKRIALNNLTEIKDYYTRLVAMKKDAGLEVKIVKKINGKNYLVTL